MTMTMWVSPGREMVKFWRRESDPGVGSQTQWVGVVGAYSQRWRLHLCPCFQNSFFSSSPSSSPDVFLSNLISLSFSSLLPLSPITFSYHFSLSFSILHSPISLTLQLTFSQSHLSFPSPYPSPSSLLTIAFPLFHRPSCLSLFLSPCILLFFSSLLLTMPLSQINSSPSFSPLLLHIHLFNCLLFLPTFPFIYPLSFSLLYLPSFSSIFLSNPSL